LGGLVARGVSPDLGVLSDGAPQFVLFVHAACWVHADRPFDKLIPHNEEHRAAIEKVRTQLWDLYKDLKAYRLNPDEAARPEVTAPFDALVEQRTGYPRMDGALKEMRDHKADLLRVLERPEIPLHNNAVESDIREFVKRRTRNDAGRRCRASLSRVDRQESTAAHRPRRPSRARHLKDRRARFQIAREAIEKSLRGGRARADIESREPGLLSSYNK
jgi:hypothetical protein